MSYKPHMHRRGDLGICLCALLCAGQGEGGLAVYGHMTMFSIGSLVGQVLCIVYYIVQYVQIGEPAMGRGGVGG